MRKLLTILLTMIALGAASQTTQLLGGPSIRVVNRGDMQVDSILYIPRTIVTSRAPFQSGALRYQGSDSTLYYWTGTAWRRVSPLIDTVSISTRAWRQKGVDSLVTLISTLGGGTVLSVSAGTGMNFTTITTSGSVSADTNVLSTRAWRRKGDDSLGAVIAGKVNISDTATMLSAYLRRADTTSMLSPYLRKTDTTAMLAPYLRNAGFGLTKGTQALSVDSALMATRARVQKGIDSVASLVTTIDSLTFSTRAWRQKGVDSVAALANTKATATGTTNYLSKFTGTSSLGNSIVYATTSEVGISTPSPTESLDVNGRVRVRTIDSTATGMNMLYADASGVIKKAAIPAGGSGSVTSVSAGTGMSFSTITTTGSVSADTVALATRAWRQKGIDSVAAIANAKVNISDTATMLTPYNRGSGTLNYIPKYLETGRRLGNSQIFDNGTSVGIGTTSPARTLDVNGSIRVGNSQRVEFGGTTTHLAGESSSNTLFFSTNNAERMRLTAAGRLLVGTTTEGTNTVDIAGTLRSTQGANFATSSGGVRIGDATAAVSTLDVQGNISATTNYRFSNNAFSQVAIQDANGAFAGGYNLTLSGANAQHAATGGISGYQLVGGTNNSTVRFIADSSRAAGTNAAIRMSILPSGNVGIGTTSPDSRLSVIGDGTGIIRMGSGVGGNSATIGLTGAISSTNYTLSGDAGNSNLAINRPTGGAMSFRSNGSAQMTLTSAGRLLVGTETEGTNTVDINGTLRTVNGANFATTSGEILMGMADAGDYKVQMGGATYFMSGVNTALTTAAGLHYMAKGDNTYFTGFNFQGVASSDMFFGRTASSDDLVISTSNTGSPAERVRFAQAGNVGIGTGASPSERLDVNGRIRARTIDSTSSPINMLTSDVNGVIRKAAVPTAASVDTNTIATRARVQKAVDSINNVNASGTGISGYINRWSGSKTMDTSQIFQQANRIGIGTTTPDARLVVVGDGTGLIRIGGGVGGNTASIGMTGAISSTAYTLAGDPGTGNVTLNRPSGGALSFAHANTEQARFDGNGTFLINTTTSDANVRLRVNGRARVETIDSSAGPINMLWADNNGVIRKAAVPSGGGGSGTVTSVATGFGIDGGTITTTGTLTADTFEVASRLRLYKVADSLAALSRITGSGTANYVPLFTSSTALGNSSIFEQSSEVRIGTTSDAGAFRLQVNGVTYSSGGIRTDAPSGGTAQTWKFGSAIADSVALDANNYLEVEVNGVFYRIALITLL